MDKYPVHENMKAGNTQRDVLTERHMFLYLIFIICKRKEFCLLLAVSF